MLTADGKETDYGGWYVGRDSLGHEVVVFREVREPGRDAEVGVTLGPVWQAIPATFDSATARSASTRRPEGDVARRPAMIGRGREGRMVRREGIEPSTY